MQRIQVGHLTKILTVDGRAYIGTLTGYAEVAQGENMLEEVYLAGCGDTVTVLVSNIRSFDQSDVWFDFKPPAA